MARVTETAKQTGTVSTKPLKQPGRIARIYGATVDSAADVIEDTAAGVAHGTRLFRGAMAKLDIEAKEELMEAKVSYANSYVRNTQQLESIGMSFEKIDELLAVRY